MSGTIESMVTITCDEYDRLRAQNAELLAALRECEEELDAYYRAEYPENHPYNEKKLVQALNSNPARAAIAKVEKEDRS